MGTPTPNYGFTLPTVNGDSGSWGTENNGNWSLLDGLLSALPVSSVSPVSVNANVLFGPGLLTIFEVTTGAATITLGLPSATVVANKGKILFFIKVDSSLSGGNVVIQGAQNINGQSFYPLINQYQVVAIYSNGVQWSVLWAN